MEYDGAKTIIGRILSEVSWAGRKVKDYRKGGAGFENVLTAEVFQLLDLLPRNKFLYKILEKIKMMDGQKFFISKDEAEEMELDILPGNYYLKKNFKTHQEGMSVQPDGFIESNKTLIMIEAKRIKSSSFQQKQLAKEFFLLTREAKEKKPFLLLITSKNPPFLIKGLGRKKPEEDILDEIESVYLSANNHDLSLEDIKSRIKRSLGWITWFDIIDICHNQLENLNLKNSSYENSIKRMVKELDKVIKRHS